jgi:hypothetical protein
MNRNNAGLTPFFPILKSAVLLLTAILFAATVSAKQPSSCNKLIGSLPQSHFVVIGRVVDDNGKPIKGSDVSLDPRGSTELRSPYESVITDENGCFKFEGFGDKRAKKATWFLYTTDNFISPGIARISPPFVGHLPKLEPRYNGIPFVPGDRAVVDMGNVPVVFWYGSARLRFEDCPEDKCSFAIQWPTAEVSIVHCTSNKWVERGTLSKEKLRQYIYNPDADLIYLLPAGRWKINIYNRGEKKPVAATACFDIKRNKVIDLSAKLVGSGHRQ